MWVSGGVSFHGYGGDGYVYDKRLSLSPKGTFSSPFVFMFLTSSKSTVKSERLLWIYLCLGKLSLRLMSYRDYPLLY